MVNFKAEFILISLYLYPITSTLIPCLESVFIALFEMLSGPGAFSLFSLFANENIYW